MADLTASGPCPYLGRCDDPDNYYGFASEGNCCHSGTRPFPVEPSYQVDNCLRNDWPECSHYRESLAGVSSENPILANARRVTSQAATAWGSVVVAVVVVSILIGVWLLAFRPKDLSEAGAIAAGESTAITHEATSDLGTVTAQAATQTPTQTPTPSASPTTAPSRTPVPTAAPTTTQTPTRTPSATLTAAPTSTPSATSSPTSSMMPSPTTVVPRPTRYPTRTPTPLPVPELLSPEDGQGFLANDEIVLRWQPVGDLPMDAYYVVTVAYSRLGDTWYDETPWIQDTRWLLSEHDYLLDLSDNGKFFWSVQVMRQTDVDAEGKPRGIAISPSSDSWSLTWRKVESTSPPLPTLPPPPTRTPVPPPPTPTPLPPTPTTPPTPTPPPPTPTTPPTPTPPPP